LSKDKKNYQTKQLPPPHLQRGGFYQMNLSNLLSKTHP